MDPDLAYEAAEESRRQAGENVIAAQTSRIDVLQRVIWPLIVLLAALIFCLLYKAVTG